MHSRHFTPYSLYIGNVNTVAQASHQLTSADHFHEISLQKDSNDENQLLLIILFVLGNSKHRTIC